MTKVKAPRTYKQKKRAGICVRLGCKRIPRRTSKRGARKSYCQFHTKENAKHKAASLARRKLAAAYPAGCVRR
jgi:hypothetical protein